MSMDNILEEEMVAINAIYGDDTFQQSSVETNLFILNLPMIEVSLQIRFPHSYPEEAPQLLGPSSSGPHIPKGRANEVASLASKVLGQIFQAGEPCVFALLEGVSDSPELAELSSSKHQLVPLKELEPKAANGTEVERKEDAYELPVWSFSEVVTEKKSTFIAHTCSVKSPAHARFCIGHLIDSDKKISKATHNISAWRIRDAENADVTYQDSDDDGEDAAGARLLHLLKIMNVWNSVVIVSRWYGGVKLGPDRFRIVNAVAKESIANHMEQHPS